MNISTLNRPLSRIAALLTILTLTSLACSISGVGLNTVSPVFEVTLHQDEFNDLSTNADVHVHASGHCDLLDEVTRIEFHDGFIRFSGTKYQPDGSDADGSLDLSLGAENDILKVRIVAVDIPGVNLKHHCIIEANEELEEELSHMVTDTHGEVLFKEVVVEDGVLRMKIQVNIK